MLTALLLALAALVVPVPASAATDVGVEGPSHSGTGQPTGTKRQTNALWFNDGIWWGNLWDTASQDFEIFRFNASTNSWSSTGVTTETRADTHHDVLWDGTTLFVASYRFVSDGASAVSGSPTTMRRYKYDPGTDKYTLLGSSQINNHRTETLSIDKDSKGRVWATWQQGNRIYLNVTRTDGSTWETTSGFPHPSSSSSVSIDDNSALIAFGGDKIGVMWSRQMGNTTDGMYWSYRPDTAAWDTGWTTPKQVVEGQRSGDDHMNLKWLDSSSDKVFAAIKTSFTSSAQPLIQLLALNVTTSTWSVHTIATVAECPNRVIVLIDEDAQKLRTFATYPKPSGTTNAGVCTSSGGAIYEKSTSLSAIDFTNATKTPRIVDADQYVHNVTSTKQNLNSTRTPNSGVLVLADVNATSRYWHFYEGSTGGGTTDTTAPTVTATSPTGTGVAVTSNVTGTFSESMDATTISSSTFTLTVAGTSTPVAASLTMDSANRVATLNPTADLGAGTTYTAAIKGGSSGVKDLAGNALATDRTWTFTTVPASTTDTTPPTVTDRSPANLATGVAATSNVTGTFSEAMNGTTITSSTFILTAPGTTTPLAATASYDSATRVATLNPTADLAAGTTYTATIKGGTSGVKDVAGNALAGDHSWSFSTAPAGTSVTLTTIADSYVLDGISAGTNFGTSTLLAVDASPRSTTYLKFDLTPYTSRSIASATLLLRSSGSGSTGTQNIKLVADDSWTETGITYSNSPGLGSILGSFGSTAINTDRSITLDANALVGEPGQLLSLGLDSSSSDGLDLNSKETAYAPKLVLTFK